MNRFPLPEIGDSETHLFVAKLAQQQPLLVTMSEEDILDFIRSVIVMILRGIGKGLGEAVYDEFVDEHVEKAFEHFKSLLSEKSH